MKKTLIGLLCVMIVAPATSFAQMRLNLECPTNQIIWSCGTNGALLRYETPAATSTCARATTVTCLPEAGTLLLPGTYTVNCVAANDCGERAACTFSVIIVADSGPPTMQCTNISVYTTNKGPMAVWYAPPLVTDNQDSEARARCNPPPGSLFPIGITPVVCRTIDNCGNQTVCTFTLEVVRMHLAVEHTRSGLALTWSGDATLECADQVTGRWEPVRGANSPFPINPTAPQKFYRLSYPPACCGTIVNDPGETSYVQVGLIPMLGEGGLPMQRFAHDDDMDGGEIILAAGSGGGLDRNCWSGVINLPFAFRFYGEPFNQFCVSKHGLFTFDTTVAGDEISTAALSLDTNWPMPNGYYPENTIACFHGRFQPLSANHHVRAWVYGDAPYRQVWIVWAGHTKFAQGSTYTALVLEESSNNILMVDMYSENDIFGFDNGFTTVGIQKDASTYREVPASPLVSIINRSLQLWDNDYYLFRPYIVGQNVTGGAAPGLESVDDLIAQRIKERNLPGVTVAVSLNGRLVLNKGYGYAHVEQNVLMQPHHRAGIGSCSKILTATGVMKLWEQGTLPNLDAKIFLDPQLLSKDYAIDGITEGLLDGVHSGQDLVHLQNITVRHLLTHTSGFTGSADDVEAANDYNDGDYATVNATHYIQWFLAHVQLTSDGSGLPGTVTDYCNENFGHLGQIIHNVSGIEYETYMQQQILNPIGLMNMRVVRSFWSDHDPAYDAKRYYWYDSGHPHAPSKFTGTIGSFVYGHGKGKGPQGSWTASAADMVRFMCATDRRNQPHDVPEILTEDTLAEMESVPFPNALPNPYAHGWDIISNPENSDFGKVSHSGAHDAARAYIVKYPDGINIAIVINTGAGAPSELAPTIRAAVNNANIQPSYDLF